VRRRRATRTLAMLLALVGAYRFRQSGLGLGDAAGMVRRAVQGYVSGGMQAVGVWS
jgi:hypothetical protein